MLQPRLVCISCQSVQDRDAITCSCGGLLEVEWTGSPPPDLLSRLDERLALRHIPHGSGVWRYHELIAADVDTGDLIGGPEGNTPLFRHPELDARTGVTLGFKHEGMNPTGSFKDRGMAVAMTEAVRRGIEIVACASTGNTSASMAAYAQWGGLVPLVFVPEGKIAGGKLAQAAGYGAHILQIEGSFDDAMALVSQVAETLPIYLLNSVNPWRIEGQKTILFEILQERNWSVPDWIVLPAGNLGNTSAIGKALRELKRWGWIDRLPRVAAVQARGASPFASFWAGGATGNLSPEPAPETVATAIRIGAPRSWEKARTVIQETEGTVLSVDDAEILDAKAQIDGCGIGCEPASATTLAGILRLRQEGIMPPGADVVAILTGHLLKDPETTVAYHESRLPNIASTYANPPKTIPPTTEAVEDYLNIL